MLGLHCCSGFSLVAEGRGRSLVVHGLLIVVTLVGHRLQGTWTLVVAARGPSVVAPGLSSTGSVVVAHGCSCSRACGIFPDEGSNPCLLP